MSTDGYVPSEEDMREAWRAFTGPNRDHGFGAWLARVRREAQWEAWTDCVSEASAAGWLHPSAVVDMLYRNPFKETP